MLKLSKSEADSKRDRIVRAATDVFFRYGYGRATIGDIAKEAEVHRPALYLLFPDGKAELFEAVLLRLVEGEVARYRQELAGLPTLREKLFFCVEAWSMGSFRLLDQHPDAKDAFNITYPAVRKMYAVLASFYSELISDAARRCPLNISAEQLANILVFSLRGTRDLADGAERLREITTQQVDLFLAALAAPADVIVSDSIQSRRSRD